MALLTWPRRTMSRSSLLSGVSGPRDCMLQPSSACQAAWSSKRLRSSCAPSRSPRDRASLMRNRCTVARMRGMFRCLPAASAWSSSSDASCTSPLTEWMRARVV